MQQMIGFGLAALLTAVLANDNAGANEIKNSNPISPGPSKNASEPPGLSAAGQRCQRVVSGLNRCQQDIVTFDPADETVRIPSKNRILSCSDRKNLPFYSRAEDMDIASVLFREYERGPIAVPERRSFQDPGRLRNTELLKSVYGNSKPSVEAKLVPVPFLGHWVSFNRENGAAESLERVGRRLEQLAGSVPAVNNYLKPFMSGKSNLANDTFNWRLIDGSKNLSAHSFGIAIDLETGREKNTYWLWEEKARRKKEAVAKRDQELAALKAKATPRSADFSEGSRLIDERLRQNIAKIAKLKESSIGAIRPGKMHTIPWQVVEAFEAEGFIWGGKWNHFDCMHFEYRPEFFPDLKPGCMSHGAKADKRPFQPWLNVPLGRPGPLLARI